jgi:hypothetical protein
VVVYPVREVGVWQRISHFSSIYRRRSDQLTGWTSIRLSPISWLGCEWLVEAQVSIALGLISNTGNERASTLDDVLASRACPTLSTPVCASLARSRARTNLSRLSSSVLGNVRHCLRPAVSSWERIHESNGASVGFQVSPPHFTALHLTETQLSAQHT